MLVVYRKADRKRITGLNTNRDLPNGPDFTWFVQTNILPAWGGTVDDYGEYRLHDVDAAATIAAIDQAADWDLVFDADGTPIEIVTYPYLSVAAAPNPVAAGDMVTIIAALPPGAADTEVGFQVEGGEETLEPVANLQATKTYAFTTPGTYRVTCRSMTRHGARAVEVIVQ